jgi:hypothetical protein
MSATTQVATAEPEAPVPAPWPEPGFEPRHAAVTATATANRAPGPLSLRLPAPGSIPPPPSFGGPPTETLRHLAIDQGTAEYQTEAPGDDGVSPLQAAPSPPDHPLAIEAAEARESIRAAPAWLAAPPIEEEEPPRRSRPPLFGILLLVVAGAVGALLWFGGQKAAAPPAAAPLAVAPAPSPERPPAPAEPAPQESAAATVAQPGVATAAPRATPRAAPAAPVLPAPPRRGVDPAAQADRAQKLTASAERKYERGDFAGAVAEFRRSLAARPTPSGLVGLARALYDSNQTAEALKVLESAQKLDPRYAPTYLLLGEIQQGEGKVAQAKTAYQRFLQLQPTGEQARAVREIIAKQLR